MLSIRQNFSVDGKAFSRWFNQDFLAMYGNTVIERGLFAGRPLFPYTLSIHDFANFMRTIPDLTDRPEINLSEFCGHFSIVYNETGGRFRALPEQGGARYLFEPNERGKLSYNGLLGNELAGDQLKARGSIRTPEDVQAWNSRQRYPLDAPLAIRREADEWCDFSRFAGNGFNQITGKNNYVQYFLPVVEETLEELSRSRIIELFQDIKIAARTFRNFTLGSQQGRNAIAALREGNYVPYGNLVSGFWYDYVKNQFEIRCLLLQEALQNRTIQALPAYIPDNLSPQEVRTIQNALLNFGIEEAARLIRDNGGADGVWGAATQEAFLVVGVPIETLLQSNRPETAPEELDNLSVKQIKMIIHILRDHGDKQVREALPKQISLNLPMGELKQVLYNSDWTIPKLLQKQGEIYQLEGRIQSDNPELSLASLKVEVWDKDGKTDDFLGEDYTDSTGRFYICFGIKAFKDSILDRKPDLIFQIFRGNTLVYANSTEPIKGLDPGVHRPQIKIES